MEIKSLEDLLIVGMTYSFDAENQLSKEAAKMAHASNDSQVKEVFEKSVTQGEKYAERLKSAFQKLGQSPETGKNNIVKAMMGEVEDLISGTKPGPLRDAALVAAFNQQQAYRVASYGSLKTYAELIGEEDAIADLQLSLDEAKSGDEKLTKIAQQTVNKQAVEQPVAG